MVKKCLGLLFDFLFCKNTEIDNTVSHTRIQIKGECPICLEYKTIELCCIYCNYKTCIKCKKGWSLQENTCPICRETIY